MSSPKLMLGIVGLPNVGKSTLFNALTAQNIPAENYPFCTIDPNVGVVRVKDERIITIGKLAKSGNLVNAVIEFVDIAGLVRGAHKGEGLGNEFLGHIRAVDAIVHLLRVFKNENVSHVEDRVDPEDDKEIIETELIMKDIDSLERIVDKLNRDAKRDKDLNKFLAHSKEILLKLEAGEMAVTTQITENDMDLLKFRKELFLLTDKPIIYVVNGDWEDISESLEMKLRKKLNIGLQFEVIPLNVKNEYELAQLSVDEQIEFKRELNIKYSGLEKLTRVSYDLLSLISFFTAGEKETRAWTITKGTDAAHAAGVIHSDFQTKFITAEVTSYEEFLEFGGWQGVRDHGKLRLEGKDYVVKDGDVILFKHGA